MSKLRNEPLLIVSDYLEAIEVDVAAFGDAGLATSYINLLLHRINSVQVRQKKASLVAAFYDNAVTLNIKGVLGIDTLRVAENVDGDVEPFELVGLYRLEARI